MSTLYRLHAYAVPGHVRCVAPHTKVAIPRRALGLDPSKPLDITLKRADNVQTPGDIMDFYLSGDVAPLGRFV